MEVSGQLHAPRKNPSTHWVGGLGGLRADLDGFGERKPPVPTGIRTPDCLSPSLLATAPTLDPYRDINSSRACLAAIAREIQTGVFEET
jgi:hypothetical protein